jgi:hypothetical protein
LWAICALQIWPLSAAADGFSQQASVQVGRPLRTAQLSLKEGDSLIAELLGARIPIPARGVRKATVESVRVAPDAGVTIVRVAADNGEWIALLGGSSGKELLVVERADLHGDPGEQRALVVSVEKDGSSDLANVSVGTRHDGLALCGSPQPLLPDRRVVDAKTLKLMPQPRLPAPAALGHASAVAQPSASQPRLPLLRGTSSTVIDALTTTPQAPQAAVDGRPDTSWAMPPSSLGLFRWSARGLPIERFEIELVGRKGPAALTFHYEGGAFDVNLPRPGSGSDRFAIAPPAAISSSCLALSNGASGPLQIAELVPLTRVDAADGLDRLVSELIQDGPTSSLAAELLASMGESAARAVAARYDELSARGARRALRVFAHALALPEVETRVLTAARAKDEALQQAAIAALAHGKEPGTRILRALALETSSAGDAAVRTLASADRHELNTLLGALAAPGGADRPTLRRALIAIGRRTPDEFDQAVETFQDAKPSGEARAALALIAAAAERPKVGLTLAEAALDVADFPSRFRLALAASQLPPSHKLDAWLGQKAGGAEEWMLRREAYEALRARGSEQAATLASQLARDKYPRVRASAAQGLAQGGQSAPLRELAREDPWPLVRVAAVRSLAADKQSRGTLAEGIDDSSRNVRSAAIDALAQQEARELWPRIAQRLVKEDEWPVVKAAALRFAGAVCVQEARDALTAAARRALRPDATDDDRSLGLDALRALHDLGGKAAADARLIAERESGSPELKAAMTKAGPSRCEAKTAASAR